MDEQDVVAKYNLMLDEIMSVIMIVEKSVKDNPETEKDEGKIDAFEQMAIAGAVARLSTFISYTLMNDRDHMGLYADVARRLRLTLA